MRAMEYLHFAEKRLEKFESKQFPLEFLIYFPLTFRLTPLSLEILILLRLLVANNLEKLFYFTVNSNRRTTIANFCMQRGKVFVQISTEVRSKIGREVGQCCNYSRRRTWNSPWKISVHRRTSLLIFFLFSFSLPCFFCFLQKTIEQKH